MRFTHPEAFLLFIPLILTALYAWKRGVRQRSRLFFPMGNWIDGRPRFQLPSPFKLHYILRLLALTLAIIALARPQSVFTKEKRNVEAIDIIISFDLSKSMDAVDFEPNRRTVAINTIKSFINSRSDDRIGLVLFSGDAYLAVPVTLDHEILIDSIEASSNRLLQDGTAIGQSLAVGVHHLRNSKAKSRIIILVTDGDNNMGSVDPRTAAELAKAYNIKIYTIGIGKKGKVRFPVVRGNRTQWEWLEDAVDEKLLGDIAQETGGQFFRASDAKLLDRVFQQIDKLEKTEVESETLVHYSELAWPWLLAAFLLLAFEAIALNTRWRKFP